MKIKPYLNKLSNSKEYKDFVKKYNDAYLMAGFFIIDLEEGKNIHQIDYFIPSKKKIAAFTLDKNVNMQILDTMNSHIPGKLDLDVRVDLDALPGILEDEMKNRGITDEIKKIVAILQNIEGKKIWNLNCILSGMGILRAHVEDESESVLKMEKVSLIDIMKKIPAMGMQQGHPAQQINSAEKTQVQAEEGQEQQIQPTQIIPSSELTQEEMKQELEKLDKLQDAIMKEKRELEKQLKKNPKASEKEINKIKESAVKDVDEAVKAIKEEKLRATKKKK